MCIYIYIYASQLGPRESVARASRRPPSSATCKHGWGKHGFSRILSNSQMVIIDIVVQCSSWYSAKFMLTPTMFSRRRAKRSTPHHEEIKGTMQRYL